MSEDLGRMGAALGDTASQFVEQALVLLFTGTDYSCYRHTDTMRMDDLLVRQRALSLLRDAKEAFQGAVSVWREAAIPPATREQPYPSPAIMSRLRSFERIIDAIDEKMTLVSAAPAPTADAVWKRFREESSLLGALRTHDLELVQACEGALKAVQALSAEALASRDDPAAALQTALTSVDHSLRVRRDLLAVTS